MALELPEELVLSLLDSIPRRELQIRQLASLLSVRLCRFKSWRTYR